MKTTLDIPDKALRDVIKFSREKTKRAAVLTAINEYNRRRHVAKFLKKLGTMDGFMTLEELYKMREMD
jgi:hypothetical protein